MSSLWNALWENLLFKKILEHESYFSQPFHKIPIDIWKHTRNLLEIGWIAHFKNKVILL